MCRCRSCRAGADVKLFHPGTISILDPSLDLLKYSKDVLCKKISADGVKTW